MQSSKNAFTMIELIFVIVILGILAAVAIPKLSATRSDAKASLTASNIMTGAAEISSYAVAKGKTEGNFSLMSNAVAVMENTGDVVVTNNNAQVAVGNSADCVDITIVQNATDDILSISFGNTQNDSICQTVQSLINVNDYPIKLRGQSVSY